MLGACCREFPPVTTRVLFFGSSASERENANNPSNKEMDTGHILPTKKGRPATRPPRPR